MVTALPAPAGTGRKVPEGRKAQLELSKHRELPLSATGVDPLSRQKKISPGDLTGQIYPAEMLPFPPATGVCFFPFNAVTYNSALKCELCAASAWQEKHLKALL